MQEIKSIAAQALTALQQGGANKGAVSAAVRETKEFNVDNGKFSLFRTLYDHALSLTALCDGKRGTVGINRFDDAAVADAVQNCLEVANSGKADPAFDIAPAQPAQQFALGAPVCDTERLFARTQELLQTIQTRHPKIVVEQMIVSHTQNRSVFTNSNGVLYERYSGVYAVELTYSAHEGTLTSSFCSSGSIFVTMTVPVRPLFSSVFCSRYSSAALKQSIRNTPSVYTICGHCVSACLVVRRLSCAWRNMAMQIPCISPQITTLPYLCDALRCDAKPYRCLTGTPPSESAPFRSSATDPYRKTVRSPATPAQPSRGHRSDRRR